MPKFPVAVTVGYIVMAIFLFAVFTAAYLALGTDPATKTSNETVE